MKTEPREEVRDKVEAVEAFRTVVKKSMGERKATNLLRYHEKTLIQAELVDLQQESNEKLREGIRELHNGLKSQTRSIVHFYEDLCLQMKDLTDEVARLRDDLLAQPRWYHKILFWRK